MTPLDRARRALFLAVSLALLAACSGGSDDDDDAPEPPDDADATGLWIGSFGGTPGRMQAIVAPDGSFVATIQATPPANNARVLVGTGTTTQNALNATGTAYASGTFPNGSAVAPLTISAGSVTDRISLSGNVSAGGETTTFSLSFLPASTRPASFATLGGVYMQPAPPSGGNTTTMTMRNDGTMTFNSTSGCVGNGTFTVPDPAWNVYRWSMTFAGCPNNSDGTVSGLGALVDTAGGTANLLTMIGIVAALHRPFTFNGTR